MMREEMKQLNLTPIEDFITEDFGELGTPSRTEFEAGVDAFILGETSQQETIAHLSHYQSTTSSD